MAAPRGTARLRGRCPLRQMKPSSHLFILELTAWHRNQLLWISCLAPSPPQVLERPLFSSSENTCKGGSDSCLASLKKTEGGEGTFQPLEFLLSSSLLLFQPVWQAEHSKCSTALSAAAYGIKVLLKVSEVSFCPFHLWERTYCN